MHAALTDLHAERVELASRLALVDEAIVAVRRALRLPDVEDVQAAPAVRKLPTVRLAQSPGEAKIEVRIISALSDGPLSPGALAEALGMTVSALRYRTDRMVECGALVVTGTTQTRRVALSPGRAAKEAP